MNKKSVLFGLTAATALLLSACSTGGDTADSGSKGGSDKLADEQVMTYVESAMMPTADLSVATDATSFLALNAVYEGLYRVDADQQITPGGAAELAEVSEDGLTYKIKLREDAKWSNGDPVTAADYVFGWQRTVDPKTASQYAYLFAPVKNATAIAEGKADVKDLGIKAVSDYELEINLDIATPYFDYLLAFPSFFPQHESTVEEFGDDYAMTSENAVYNGPFTLAGFDGPGSDTEWSYVKNPDYWDADTVKMDEVKVTVVTEASTGLNLFQDGQADYTVVSGELAQQLAGDPAFVTVPEGTTAYLEMNQNDENSPFRNANLRKAISAAIDRESFVNNILANGSVPAPGLVPGGLAVDANGKEFTEATDVEGFAFDKAAAGKYWEKAKEELGIDSLEFEVLSDDTEGARKTVEYLQGAIQDALPGVTVKVANVPFAVRLDRSTNGDFDTVVSLWGADYADPSSFLDLFTSDNSYNRGGWSNADYDKLIKDAATTNANDPAKRWQNLVDAENIMSSELGVLPLYQRSVATMQSPNLHGLAEHASGVKTDFKWAYFTEE
jgi:ABC-type oligopeptide transport system, periplasmic component